MEYCCHGRSLVQLMTGVFCDAVGGRTNDKNAPADELNSSIVWLLTVGEVHVASVVAGAQSV